MWCDRKEQNKTKKSCKRNGTGEVNLGTRACSAFRSTFVARQIQVRWGRPGVLLVPHVVHSQHESRYYPLPTSRKIAFTRGDYTNASDADSLVALTSDEASTTIGVKCKTTPFQCILHPAFYSSVRHAARIAVIPNTNA